MTCPSCGRTRHTVSYTINSDQAAGKTRDLPPNTIKRQRKCRCGHTFTTVELHHDALELALKLIHVSSTAQTN